MLKRIIYTSTICVGLLLSIQQNSFSQATKEELKAERDALKSEMKSKDAEERKAKMDKLVEPKPCGVASVDELASNSTKILTNTREINSQVPEMYKRTIGETVDGVTDVTVKKPTAAELAALALTITSQIKAVSDASAAMSTASNDMKSATPMQMPKATKSMNYSKDVLAISASELQLSLKVVNNLIATLKSSGNN